MNDVYGGTYRLFSKVLAPQGYTFEYADLSDLETVENALTRGPGVVWVETPTNPLLKIVDIAAIAERAHSVGAVVVVDNTFASPYLQQPLALGADIVVHSTTKYIGGHSDAVGGIAITSDDGARGGARRSCRTRSARCPGRSTASSPCAARRRWRSGCASTARTRAAIADYLVGAAAVSDVLYPGLADARQPRGRRPPDARLRRHGLVPRSAAAARPPTRLCARPASGRWARASAASRAWSSTPAR